MKLICLTEVSQQGGHRPLLLNPESLVAIRYGATNNGAKATVIARGVVKTQVFEHPSEICELLGCQSAAEDAEDVGKEFVATSGR